MIVNIFLVVIYLIVFSILIHRRELFNHLKSLMLTHAIHQMLVIPMEEVDTFNEKIKPNKPISIYNSFLRQTYAEYKDSKLYLFIRIPNNLSAEKLLDNKLDKLCEAVDDKTNHKYFFAKFERHDGYYIRIGTK